MSAWCLGAWGGEGGRSRRDDALAELVFEDVDESAWVWVNGECLGGQATGPSGWDQPFRVDATDAVRWNVRNLMVARAMNTVGGGGVRRPVFLECRLASGEALSVSLE